MVFVHSIIFKKKKKGTHKCICYSKMTSPRKQGVPFYVILRETRLNFLFLKKNIIRKPNILTNQIKKVFLVFFPMLPFLLYFYCNLQSHKNIIATKYCDLVRISIAIQSSKQKFAFIFKKYCNVYSLFSYVY